MEEPRFRSRTQNPQITAIAPQKTPTAPQKPTQKTAVAPQRQQSAGGAPQKTALAGPPLKIPSSSDGPHAPGDVVTVGGKSYTVEKCIGSGTEGHLYIVRDKKARYALKLFHGGYHPNQKVLSALQPLKGKGCLATILEYGNDYELMELIPLGSATEAGIKGNAQAILAIAVKVAMALDKVKGRITVPPDMPDPLAKICRGLLIRNPAKRWDLGEILLTIEGKEVPVAPTMFPSSSPL